MIENLNMSLKLNRTKSYMRTGAWWSLRAYLKPTGEEEKTNTKCSCAGYSWSPPSSARWVFQTFDYFIHVLYLNAIDYPPNIRENDISIISTSIFVITVTFSYKFCGTSFFLGGRRPRGLPIFKYMQGLFAAGRGYERKMGNYSV